MILDTKKPSSLRRSISERFVQEPAKVVFHDTTALRSKTIRPDSRIAFAGKDLERLDGINYRLKQNSSTKTRPRKPPPPPPAQPTTSELQNPTNEALDVPKQTLPSNENDQRSEPTQVLSVGEEKAKSDRVVVVSIHSAREEEKRTEATISTPQTEETNQSEVVLKEVAKSFPPLAPPRKRSNNKSPPHTPPPIPAVQSINQSLAENTCNKITVQISPTKPIHKIQIKNEFVESANVQSVPVFDNSQRKTSILINGDDCYCTVNVNDDVPLYQSSVVVKDSPIKCASLEPLRNSSSVYITGNFSNKINFAPEPKENYTSKESPSQGTRDESVSPMVQSNVSICNAKETENKTFPKTEPCTPIKSCKISVPPRDMATPAEETLIQILGDPVEAVRRNLVPHVCGKSDVTRTSTSKPENSLESYYYGKSLLEDQNSNALADSLLKLNKHLSIQEDDGCSEHSSSTQYEMMDPGSDCYTDNSNRSSVTEEELNNRTKFYELLAESALVEVSENEDHHYESIKVNSDPIYEEIEVPPPLPANPPPTNLLDDLQLDKEFTTR